MTADKLVRLQTLKEELRQLESDPDLQNQLSQYDELVQLCDAYSLEVDEAFKFLVPQMIESKPVVSTDTPGLSRLPTKADRKLAAHHDLQLLKQKVTAQLEKLEQDELIQKRIGFLDAVAALQLTPQEAAQMLSPSRFKALSQTKTQAKKKESGKAQSTPQRPLRFWRNPKTGQIASGRNTGTTVMQRWMLEHGKEIAKTWEISAEEAEKYK